MTEFLQDATFVLPDWSHDLTNMTLYTSVGPILGNQGVVDNGFN